MRFYNSILKWISPLFSIAVVSILAIALFSCDSGSDTKSKPLGEWYRESDFDGTARSSAVLFMIGETPYLGTGFTQPQNTTSGLFLKDFYYYSPGKSWSSEWAPKVPLATFPGAARSNAVAFSINGKGYVGLGRNSDGYLSDFYEYDPALNTWTQIADFPGVARTGAVAFAVEGNGYVGAGFDGTNVLKDMYAYDPTSGTWTAKAGVGGTKRYNAFSFVIGSKAYVGGGIGTDQLTQTTFWEYDPSTDLWSEKNDLREDKIDDDPNDKDYTIARHQAVTFVINGLGYVVNGKIGSSYSNQVWEYNPDTDAWIEKNAFEGIAREGSIGFSIGDRGYITTGLSGNSRFEDMWSFDPTAIDEDE